MSNLQMTMSQILDPAYPDQHGASQQIRRLLWLAWAVFAIFALVDLIWWPLSRLTFAPANFFRAGISVLVLGLISGAARAIGRRIHADDSGFAGVLLSITEGLAILIRAAVFSVLFGIAGLTFSYLAASTGWPLQDAQLAALDRSLGFDWPSFLAWTNSSRLLSSILLVAYHSAGPQMLLLYLFLSLTKREQRLAEFIALLAVTSLATGVLTALVPAAGAYAYFEPPRHFFSNMSANAGMWHFELLQSLRTEAAPILDFSQAKGLVTFPSFHTALAIITAYAVRDVPYVARPALLLNLVVIVSTLPEGGHHLVDVVAGAIIAGVAIVIVRLHVAGWSLSLFKRGHGSLGTVSAEPEG